MSDIVTRAELEPFRCVLQRAQLSYRGSWDALTTFPFNRLGLGSPLFPSSGGAPPSLPPAVVAAESLPSGPGNSNQGADSAMVVDQPAGLLPLPSPNQSPVDVLKDTTNNGSSTNMSVDGNSLPMVGECFGPTVSFFFS